MKKNTFILTVILCILSTFTRGQTQHSTPGISHSYTTKEQAKEVLDYYQKYLLKSDFIHFIAIIQNPESKLYELAIGAKKSQLRNLILITIDPQNVYEGKFSSNHIPQHFPIPSDMENKSKNIKSVLKTKILDIAEEIDTGIIGNIPKRLWSDSRSRMGALNISRYGESKGTLGGIFELEEFPGELFGISNWHVLSGECGKLGDTLYASIDDERPVKIGHLFWKSLDDYREAAIVMFNSSAKKFLLEKFKNEIIRKIGTIKNNQKVYQRGMSTIREEEGGKESSIFSNYGIVTISSPRLPGDKKTFHKQLFIQKFTTDGDSGSITFDKNVDDANKIALGLNFSVNITPYYRFNNDSNQGVYLTFSNNINLIFNHVFKEKQEIFYNNKIKTIKQFILKTN